jgi:hypothetical protein
MKFWDSSAIVCVVAEQSGDEKLQQIMADDPNVVIWWGTRVEIASGLHRLRCEGGIDDQGFSAFLRTAEQIVEDADETESTDRVRLGAVRMLEAHRLRAADAVQLSSALCWADNDPLGKGFVCLDKRLREAAEIEGFDVLPK